MSQEELSTEATPPPDKATWREAVLVYLGLLLLTLLSLMSITHAATSIDHFSKAWGLEGVPLVTESFLSLGCFLRGALWWILLAIPVASVFYLVWCRKTYRRLLWTTACCGIVLVLMVVYAEIAVSLLLIYTEKPVTPTPVQSRLP